MVINPHKDCTWTYDEGRLSINLTTDEGSSYKFRTHYRVEDLAVRPEVNSQFCIQDATLLTDYQYGLDKVLRNEEISLDLGLNAVACERFTRPACPSSRYFLSNSDYGYMFSRGDVVIVYSKCGDAGYCLVLEENDADGLVRLMLLTDQLVLDKEHNRGYQVGMMIRVHPQCIYELNVKKVRYA